MILDETKIQEVEKPKRTISAEIVLSYVVIGCSVVAILGILATMFSRDSGVSLLASAVALGVIAFIYRR